MRSVLMMVHRCPSLRMICVVAEARSSEALGWGKDVVPEVVVSRGETRVRDCAR